MAGISSSMLYNLSQSLIPFQSLITGVGYFFGIAMFMVGMEKLRSIGDMRPQSRSQEKMFAVVAYFMGGAALIYSPSMITVLANTAFGGGSLLQYSPPNPYSVASSMKIIIQTAGVIWFVRGVTMMVHASEPGGQEGGKGLAFMCGGIFGIYFEQTVEVINYIFNHLFLHMQASS